jgi:hypothetical protein
VVQWQACDFLTVQLNTGFIRTIWVGDSSCSPFAFLRKQSALDTCPMMIRDAIPNSQRHRAILPPFWPEPGTSRTCIRRIYYDERVQSCPFARAITRQILRTRLKYGFCGSQMDTNGKGRACLGTLRATMPRPTVTIFEEAKWDPTNDRSAAPQSTQNTTQIISTSSPSKLVLWMAICSSKHSESRFFAVKSRASPTPSAPGFAEVRPSHHRAHPHRLKFSPRT